MYFDLLPRAARDELKAERNTIRGRAQPTTLADANVQLHELRKFVLALAHLALDDAYLTVDEHDTLLDTDPEYSAGIQRQLAYGGDSLAYFYHYYHQDVLHYMSGQAAGSAAVDSAKQAYLDQIRYDAILLRGEGKGVALRRTATGGSVS